MKVFEFHFNPKLKSDVTFDSFCYEPVNIYERRLGGLYMIGLLKSILPKNQRLVEKLAKAIKNNYYRASLQTPEIAIKDSLKLANEFLDKVVQKGNVRWLGKLDFAVISLKDFKLNFSKVGQIKVMVARNSELIDIDQKINSDDMEPYPLKIFSNMVSGKLARKDTVLVLTQDIYDLFKKEGMLEEITNLQPFSEKGLRDILDKNKEKLVDTYGILLAIVLTKEEVVGKKSTISPEVMKEFSLKELCAPFLEKIKSIKKPEISLSSLKKKAKESAPEDVGSSLKEKIKIPKVNLSFLNPVKEFFQNRFQGAKGLTSSTYSKLKDSVFNKNLVLIASLIILLGVASFFSNIEERQKMESFSQELQEIKGNLEKADSFLILKDTQPEATSRANELLQQAFDQASSLYEKTAGLPKRFREEVSSVKETVTTRLFELNSLQNIEDPQIVYRFEKREYVPQQLSLLNNNLYFSNPLANNIFLLKETGETVILETGEEKIKLSTPIQARVVFFSSPESMFSVEGENVDSFSVEPPYSDFSFSSLSAFNDHLYFLDGEKGQIIKYASRGGLSWSSPELWLESQETKLVEADSITIDGSIWVLKDNSIMEYFAGSLKRTLDFEIFPVPKDFSRIFTTPDLNHLYIIEPGQKRVVVLAKNGELIQQFQSEKFDNLLDIAVSEDENDIYLLNGLTLYKVSI